MYSLHTTPSGAQKAYNQDDGVGWVGRKKCSCEGMGGMNVMDVRREIIPSLWSTVREGAFAKSSSFTMGDTKHRVSAEEWSCLEGVYTVRSVGQAGSDRWRFVVCFWLGPVTEFRMVVRCFGKKKDYAIPPVFQCCLRRISDVKNNGKLLKQTACLYRPADSQWGLWFCILHALTIVYDHFNCKCAVLLYKTIHCLLFCLFLLLYYGINQAWEHYG